MLSAFKRRECRKARRLEVGEVEAEEDLKLLDDAWLREIAPPVACLTAMQYVGIELDPQSFIDRSVRFSAWSQTPGLGRVSFINFHLCLFSRFSSKRFHTGLGDIFRARGKEILIASRMSSSNPWQFGQAAWGHKM